MAAHGALNAAPSLQPTREMLNGRLASPALWEYWRGRHPLVGFMTGRPSTSIQATACAYHAVIWRGLGSAWPSLQEVTSLQSLCQPPWYKGGTEGPISRLELNTNKWLERIISRRPGLELWAALKTVQAGFDPRRVGVCTDLALFLFHHEHHGMCLAALAVVDGVVCLHFL